MLSRLSPFVFRAERKCIKENANFDRHISHPWIVMCLSPTGSSGDNSDDNHEYDVYWNINRL